MLIRCVSIHFNDFVNTNFAKCIYGQYSFHNAENICRLNGAHDRLLKHGDKSAIILPTAAVSDQTFLMLATVC